MHIKDVMSKDVTTIPSSANYEEAAKILYLRKVSGAPVLNEKGELVGILSDKDFYRTLYPWYHTYYESPEAYADTEAREHKVQEIRLKPVTEFMTRDVATTGPDEPIMKAGAMMLARHVHRMPVMENGKLVGIVTRSDIYKHLIIHELWQDKKPV